MQRLAVFLFGYEIGAMQEEGLKDVQCTMHKILNFNTIFQFKYIILFAIFSQ